MAGFWYNLSGSRLSKFLMKAAKSLECYFAVLFVYFEVVFHLTILKGHGENLLLKIAFGIFFGCIVGYLVSLIGGLAGKITGLVITITISVFYIAHIVYYGVFATHLSLTGSIGDANQALDFTDVIAKEVKEDWWRVLLCLIPILIYVIFVWRRFSFKRHKLITYGISAASIVVFYLLIVLVVKSQDKDIYSAYKLMKNYQSVDMSVRKLGVIETLAIELTHKDSKGKVEFSTEASLMDPEDITTTEEKTEEKTTSDKTENTTEVTTEEVKVIDTSPNILDIDFDKLIAEETDEDIIALHEYVKNVTPTKKNEYTGMFEGYNLIFVVAEGFDGYVIDKERTPTLYKMTHTGFIFKNFYTPLWYGSTLGGEFADLTGLMPNNGMYLSMCRCGVRENDMLFCLSQQLLKQGYYVTGYHNNDYTYYDRDISHPNMGYTWTGVGNGYEPERYSDGSQLWPQSDLMMIDTTFDNYKDFEPFHTYYLTVSGHVMYNFMGNAMAERHEDISENLPYSETTRAYISCQYELELAMTSLLNKLEKAGIADRTLIVLCADHVPYDNKEVVDELAGKTLGDTFEWFKNSLIIYSPSMKENVVVEKYCSTLDILPTVSNLMGLPYDSRMMVGTDILSDSPALVLFNDRSFITDKCMYDANYDEVIPLGNVNVTDEYIENVQYVVRNKFNLAQSIVDYNYYAVIDQAVYGNSVNEHNVYKDKSEAKNKKDPKTTENTTTEKETTTEKTEKAKTEKTEKTTEGTTEAVTEPEDYYGGSDDYYDDSDDYYDDYEETTEAESTTEAETETTEAESTTEAETETTEAESTTEAETETTEAESTTEAETETTEAESTTEAETETTEADSTTEAEK
ncbi:Sulfatase [Eubacterium ruminantium]|nr:Sulfatase [Eubacterium ruminantium]